MTFWTIHFLILAAIAAVFLPAFVVGCFEKRAVRSFEPHSSLPDTSYFRAMVTGALVQKFRLLGGGHQVDPRDLL
jgi:hypothetical protein